MLAAKRHMIPRCNTIGLLGGSFNPPHMGHVHITNQALKSFQLQKVFWLVSPGNPLKLKSAVSVEKRVNQCRNIVHNPYIAISDIENKLNTRFTAETLRKLFVIYPGVRFVWLMGADNLDHFARWYRYRDMIRLLPIAVVERPGYSFQTIAAGQHLLGRRIKVTKMRYAIMSGTLNLPSWCFIAGQLNAASATKIRQRTQDRTCQ